MFQILNIDENNFESAYNFLKSVPSISGVDDTILKNGIVVLDDEKVIGSVSFERFDRIGLVRYFVFKKNLSNEVLKSMMDALEDNARKQNILQLICVADNFQIEDLFKELDFLNLRKNIFINEEKIALTNFSNSNFLYKVL